MKIELDDKTFSEELARIAYSWLHDTITQERHDSLFYHKEIAESVQRNIDKLFEEHKNYILDEIINRCGEKYLKQINTLVLLDALSKKVE